MNYDTHIIFISKRVPIFFYYKSTLSLMKSFSLTGIIERENTDYKKCLCIILHVSELQACKKYVKTSLQHSTLPIKWENEYMSRDDSKKENIVKTSV